MKFKVILCCLGAIISQTHSFRIGYSFGNDGDKMVPFKVSRTPPQASEIKMKHEIRSYFIKIEKLTQKL